MIIKTEQVMMTKKTKIKFNSARHRVVKRRVKIERAYRGFEARGLLESSKDPVTGERRYFVTEEGKRLPNWNVN